MLLFLNYCCLLNETGITIDRVNDCKENGVVNLVVLSHFVHWIANASPRISFHICLKNKNILFCYVFCPPDPGEGAEKAVQGAHAPLPGGAGDEWGAPGGGCTYPQGDRHALAGNIIIIFYI